MPAISLEARIEELVREDRRYSVDAYEFVFDALEYVASHSHCRQFVGRHITIAELLEGIKLLGLEAFGPLARIVFNSWGITSTEDFGEIVFTLIAQKLLNQGEHDRKEDFANGFDFYDVFDLGYVPVNRHDEKRLYRHEKHCPTCTCGCPHHPAIIDLTKEE